MLTLAEYERLAERMRDNESSSEAQLEAESLFYAAISRDDGEGSILGDDFDRWCEHVSVDEMLDEALRLLLMVKGFADRNPPTGPLLRDGIGTLTPIPTLTPRPLGKKERSMYPPTPQQRAEAAKPREPIGAAFWAANSPRGAGDLGDILAQRRHADVWEAHRRGEATPLELLDAYMDAYVPHSMAARVAHLRELENRSRAIDDTHVLAAIAAWRLREQLKNADPDGHGTIPENWRENSR
jgi:hypothetical protein